MSFALWLALLGSLIVAAIMVSIDSEKALHLAHVHATATYQQQQQTHAWTEEQQQHRDETHTHPRDKAQRMESDASPRSVSPSPPTHLSSCYYTYPSCWSSTLTSWNVTHAPPPTPTTLPPHLQRWQAQGRFLLLSGMRVYVQDVPRQTPPKDDKEAATLLMIHGFPTSSYDYRASLPYLTKYFRVVIFDFPGFGLSSKPQHYSYSLMEQADIVLQLTLALGLNNIHLLAHDLGDSVALELISRRERGLLPWLNIRTLTLNNGGMIQRHASLRIGQRLLRWPVLGPLFARVMPAWIFKRQILSVVADPSSFPQAELDTMWILLQHLDGYLRTPLTIGYLDDRGRFEPRWLDAFRRLDIPCHIIWGKQDAVAPYVIARDLLKFGNDARREDKAGTYLTTLTDVGHFAMIENAEEWAQAVIQGITTLTKKIKSKSPTPSSSSSASSASSDTPSKASTATTSTSTTTTTTHTTSSESAHKQRTAEAAPSITPPTRATATTPSTSTSTSTSPSPSPVETISIEVDDDVEEKYSYVNSDMHSSSAPSSAAVEDASTSASSSSSSSSSSTEDPSDAELDDLYNHLHSSNE